MIDFGGSVYGGGSSPFAPQYYMDGIRVSQSFFMDTINSGLIGGAFGLLEMSARMSVRDFSVRLNDGNRQYERFFGSEGEARNFALRVGQNTVFRNILVNDSWSVINSLRPQTQLQPRQDTTPPGVIIYSSPGTKPKPLPSCIRNYLINGWNVDKNAVNSATFTRSNPIALNFTVTGTPYGLADGTYTHNINAGAFTWGNNIDFLNTAFDPSNGIDGDEVALAGHEIVHTVQYRNDANFTAKYLLNYAANLANNALFRSAAELWARGFGGIGQDAYEDIHYEEDARVFQKKITEDIRKNGNPCNAASANGKRYNP